MSRHAEPKSKSVKEVDLIVAVAGQPNVGKSTFLNRLVGALSHVGNWPGKTVDILSGVVEYSGIKIKIIDLPGTYGLSGVTEEEEIARKYILGEIGERVHRHRRFICEGCPLSFMCPMPIFCPARLLEKFSRRKETSKIQAPDVVVVLVDATAIERTFYLAVSILEVFPRVVIAVNKIDEAKAKGIFIDTKALSKRLGVPVIPISALHNEGLKEVLRAIIDVWRRKGIKGSPIKINYGVLEYYISKLEKVTRYIKELNKYPPRWIALRILEKDREILELIERTNGKIILEVKSILKELESMNGDISAMIASAKYNYISDLLSNAIKKTDESLQEISLSRFDKLFITPFIGPLVGLSIVLLTLLIGFTINMGFPLNILFSYIGLEDLAALIEEYSIISLLEQVFDIIINQFKQALSVLPPPWPELLGDGLLGGLLLVLTFLPLIFIILFLLSLLEDSGISARIAVSLDNTFSKLGLSGKAAFPMLMGLGCNVPGIMASRILMDEKEKLAVILANPFIICQARLMVLIAIVSIAFINPFYQALVVVLLYLISIALYGLAATIALKIMRGRASSKSQLIIDVPPIRKPSLRVAWWNAWLLTKHFLEKAGTIIIVLSVIVWVLLNFGPSGYTTDPSTSYGAIIGKGLAPIALIWGVNDVNVAWKVMFAFLYGIIAKEGLLLAIASLSPENTLESAWVSLGLTQLQSFVILLAMMTYIPCLATIITMKHETKSWIKTIIAASLMMLVSIALSSLIYFLGLLAGIR